MLIVANQLELSNGTRRDRSECLVDAEQIVAPPVIHKRGSLFIITETESMAAGRPRPGDIDLCREAQEIILNEYYNSQLTSTITSALRQAIEKANQAIFNRNSATLPPERRGLGITVALIRGNEIFTAQLAPTQAFLTHAGELRSLPVLQKRVVNNEALPPLEMRTGTDTPVSLSSTTTPRHQSLPALGRYTLVEPTFQRNVFEDNDVVILCSSQFSQALQESDLEWILSGQDSRNALLNLSEFARSQGISDGYAMAIGGRPDLNARPTAPRTQEESGWRGTAEGVAGAVSLFTSKMGPGSKTPAPVRPDTGNQDAPDNPPTFSPARPSQPLYQKPPTSASSAKLPGEPSNPTGQDKAGNEAWLLREDDDLNRPAYLRGHQLSQETKPGPTVPQPAPGTPYQKQPIEVFQVGQPAPTGQRDFTYTDASQEPPLNPGGLRPPTLNERPLDEQWKEPATRKSRWNGWPRRADRQPGVSASSSNTPYFDLVNNDGYGPPANEGRRQRAGLPGGRMLVLACLGLSVAVVVVAFVLVNGAVNSGDSTKAVNLVRSAEQKRAAAQLGADSNPVQARALLAQAQLDLEAARKEKATLPEIVTEQNALLITGNNINRVVIPTDLRLSLDLSSQGAGVKLSRGILNPTGDALYLLDSGRGAVYVGDATGAVKTILKTGDKSGNAVFGKPVKMVSRPDGIMVLDDGNILWLYNKNSDLWTAQTLGGTANWGSQAVQQAASYQGNLYLVGPDNGQILKYNAGNYTNNPDEWLNPALVPQLNLSNAAGLSIDGTVYTLTKDGKLVQLARPTGKDKGEILQQFDLKASDRLGPPLSSPADLNVGSLDYPYAFVLDSEKRLMQFSKTDGSFIQQFQAATDHKEFDNLQDVTIDEANKKIYLIGLQKVYIFSLGIVPGNPTGSTPLPQLQTTAGAGSNVTIITSNPTPVR